MLEDALGSGKVIAKISTDLDFEQVERTEEIFDPDSQVVRSENQISESSVGSIPPGGIPGVQALVPSGEDSGSGAGQAAQRNKSNAVFNYEINGSCLGHNRNTLPAIEYILRTASLFRLLHLCRQGTYPFLFIMLSSCS